MADSTARRTYLRGQLCLSCLIEERRAMEATYPSKCNDIVIPPQRRTATDLCVESQSEKHARKCAKEPRHAQNHRPVVPIIHLVHFGTSLSPVFAVIAPTASKALRNILTLTPGFAHGRCAQTRDNTWVKKRNLRPQNEGMRSRVIEHGLGSYTCGHGRTSGGSSSCYSLLVCSPGLSDQQFAATSPLPHVS
jgi:hypothetical protein